MTQIDRTFADRAAKSRSSWPSHTTHIERAGVTDVRPY
jgi:hypothetical protein